LFRLDIFGFVFLIGLVMANRASCRRTCTVVMSRHMAGSASYVSSRDQLKWLARKSFEG